MKYLVLALPVLIAIKIEQSMVLRIARRMLPR
jgi:hypothetical protein